MLLIKYRISTILYLSRLIFGLLWYVLSKKTILKSYLAMIVLFCRTGGRSNDMLSSIISKLYPPLPITPSNNHILPMADQPEAIIAVKELKSRGYYVFQNKLSDDLCDKLFAFATQYPAKTRLMDDDVGNVAELIYDYRNPLAVRYDFITQDLLNNRDVQKIIADLSFVSIAQEYLEAVPIVDVVAMWWHTCFSENPDAESAQFYHFDMDRLKWLKFFIYLTDVNTNNGPHSYVAGSHKTKGIPFELLRKGYSRLTDEEIASHYLSSDIIEFIAPRGTIIAEDTRGLHKGKHVLEGHRLMFQIQFSNSLFGANYPCSKFSEFLVDELKTSIQKYPRVYSAYC